MGDPLSVAASIAGLVTLSGSLYLALDKLISEVRGVPSLARTVCTEVTSFHHLLVSFRAALNRIESSNETEDGDGRACLIPAEHVVVSLTDAVLLLSELESVVAPLLRRTGHSTYDKAQWLRKKSLLVELVTRLQWHKHTFVMQLNILHSESIIIAKKQSEDLHDMILERVEERSDLLTRLELVEEQIRGKIDASVFETQSVRFFEDGDDRSETATIVATNKAADVNEERPDCPGLEVPPIQEFEESLMQSWVYRRYKNGDAHSIRCPTLRTGYHSILSQMTVAQFPYISDLALPVQQEEVSKRFEPAALLDSTSKPTGRFKMPTLHLASYEAALMIMAGGDDNTALRDLKEMNQELREKYTKVKKYYFEKEAQVKSLKVALEFHEDELFKKSGQTTTPKNTPGPIVKEPQSLSPHRKSPPHPSAVHRVDSLELFRQKIALKGDVVEYQAPSQEPPLSGENLGGSADGRDGWVTYRKD